MKITRRNVLDGLTVLLCLCTFGPYIFSNVSYENDVIPDETRVLDDEIYEYLAEQPMVFAELLTNIPEDTHVQLTQLDDRRVLTPAFNYLQNVESVVYITSEDSSGYYFGTGSILSDDGVILTNYHNIDGADRVMITTYDGQHYPVMQVIAYDAAKDIVYLKIDAQDLRPMAIGDDREMAIGEETLVIGHPEGFLNSVSLGVLSGRRRYDTTGEGLQLQITNPISGGNSGGAVLNSYGELIGIPTASIEYEDNAVQVQNINLAVPISEALKVLD